MVDIQLIELTVRHLLTIHQLERISRPSTCEHVFTSLDPSTPPSQQFNTLLTILRAEIDD